MTEQQTVHITPRAQDYNRWYQDVIRQGDLAEIAEVVKGCMVIKPHGYAIWEIMQRALDDMFKATGHQNAYFPMLIPERFLQLEAEHVEGFSPELAVVTHAGGKPLEERYVLRPTSETMIGYFFARWISSWRDLPLLINQWANVIRWELRTRMFLRTTEFLWQEGHTAHATHAEAQQEVRTMLQVYQQFAQEWMAMPVICGRKTESEKFAGALESLCIEAMMQDGKALQAGTSHDLGQNFGKAFGIRFQDQQGAMETVWQTSWGVSTRLIGGLIMTHSDDAGLILPPKLAPIQVVIVPILLKGKQEDQVLQAAKQLQQQLQAAQVRVVLDERPLKPGQKFFHWEQKGVPIRCELGPKDMAQQQVQLKFRHNGEKMILPLQESAATFVQLLQRIQGELLQAATKRLQRHTVILDDWPSFCQAFAQEQQSPFVLAHWDGTAETEATIKEQLKVTIRCIPFDSPQEPGRCIKTGRPSAQRVLFAKAY